MRRVLMCLVFVCVLGLVPAASGELIGYWTFDDPANLGADSSGKGNHGTVEGDAAFSSNAFSGNGALLLDGTDDYISVGLGANNMLANWTSNLTIAGWIKPDNLNRQWNCLFGHTVQNNGIKFELMTTNFRFTTLGVMDYDIPVSLTAGEWSHVAATFNQAGNLVTFYVNGKKLGERSGGAPATPATGSYNIGYGGYWAAEQYEGLLDEVRIYNNVLTEAEIKKLAFRPKAYAPSPASGTTGVMQPLMTWTSGTSAQFHDVYFGTTPELGQADFSGRQNVIMAMYWHFAGLQPGTTYYWRIDEVEADGVTKYAGDVWTFSSAPATAYSPTPLNGNKWIDPNIDLGWQGGMNALKHELYFGTDEAAVTARDAGTHKGPLVAATFEPGTLQPGTTYYWAVDELTMAGGTVKGDVWSFTTFPVIPIVDPSLVAWWKLDEAPGTKVVDWSGYGHHGTVVGAQWVDGYDGAALSFDGTDDYVNLGTPADLYQPTNYTYCAWFRVARNIHGNSGPQYLLCVGSRSDLIFGVEDAVGVDGDLMLHYYDTVPGFHAVGAGQTDWLADGWHMVAGTRDATGHKIYVDGVLKNSDTNTNNDNYAVTRMISLGARAWTGHQYYRGAIDEVRIYNKALTEQEIQQLMAPDPLRASDPAPALDSIVDVRDASSLAWTAGTGAVSHDVYFGTDRTSVAGTGKDSAAYKGNQAATSFSLAGLVDLSGADYYWRIDEVQADGTVVTGQLWKFTVPPYLIVDDFESYTDNSPHRVFQTWIDGWGFSPDEFFPQGSPGNGTTATVGYDPTVRRIMETTIAVSGQSAPIDYNNINQPYYAEAERTWPTPQDWTVGGVTDLSLQVRGYPIGFLETSPGNITMSGSGADIYGTTDEFRYAYKKLSGDGSLTARVESIVNTATWAKAGVIARAGLAPGAQQVHMIITPASLVEFMYRKDAGLTTVQLNTSSGTNPLPQWIRLTRKGNTFTGEYSANGTTWTKITLTDGTTSVADVPMIGDVYIGLAVSATNRNAINTAVFSNVQVTGATGAWSVAKIGYNHPGNDPATLYVAIQDGAGKTAVVPYPDTSAVLSTQWLEWKIPLTRFSTINLKTVKKMYIGVGNRDTPAKDGTGSLFIDDIRLVK